MRSLCGVMVALSAMACAPEADWDNELGIRVDQFGYLPEARKVGVLAVDAVESSRFLVRDVETGRVRARLTPVAWSGGDVHDQSDGPAMLLDFSDVTEPGTYVVESEEWRSDPFRIDPGVYEPVLHAALRTFYLQRSGIEKAAPYTKSSWVAGPDYLGPGQDGEARSILDPDNPDLARDVSGGWWDAGDTNKYVTFARGPVHQLLTAYQDNPRVWSDDTGIPESGNGVPDLLDEVRWELEWLRKMQDDDGGVFIKVGVTDFSFLGIPADDARPRFYGPPCSSSTIAVAGMFAHAALVYRDVDPEFADDLEARAVQAWDWYADGVPSETCDDQTIKAGDADLTVQEQRAEALAAAAYLFQLDSANRYAVTVEQSIDAAGFADWSAWGLYNAHVPDALRAYMSAPYADRVTTSVARDLFDDQRQWDEGLFGLVDLDPYGAYVPDAQYHWGSNLVKANLGHVNLDVVRLGLDEANDMDYVDRASASLNYLHGVNPLGVVYLSNMQDLGAERSMQHIYHAWYSPADGTPADDPPPGYLVGGPNDAYTGDAELLGELQRAYLDTADLEVRAWELSEPSISYQASYVKLLAEFVPDKVR